ncbi:hypothetical protein PoB_006850200 [Plakobranchus ocellatus]|uniref:Uncharacterized protein n=1 Tax=Plakobranchus ocellatus TaxID=259542 RepID=A0AAV4DCQ1_9GAST|nr:hypothetical protein PoB_006850200 [Plakobranchus ocellatus]
MNPQCPMFLIKPNPQPGPPPLNDPIQTPNPNLQPTAIESSTPPQLPSLSDSGSVSKKTPATQKATVLGVPHALRILMPNKAPGLKEQPATPQTDPRLQAALN